MSQYDPKIKLLALTKLVSYVKFLSREHESSEFACSPIVGEILADLKAQNSHTIANSLLIDVNTPIGRTVLASLEWHLQQTDNWHELSPEEKIEHAANITSPYMFEQRVIQSSISKRDAIR